MYGRSNEKVIDADSRESIFILCLVLSISVYCVLDFLLSIWKNQFLFRLLDRTVTGNIEPFNGKLFSYEESSLKKIIKCVYLLKISLHNNIYKAK